nr:putative phosphothreonine lyase domain-containg protein [Halomicrobium mukohataei]
MTTADLPQADSDTVREIDRDALDQEILTGKWQITGSPERIEDLFPKLVADAEDGIVWAVKAMTTFGFENLPMYDEYVLAVYTPNYFDHGDVHRVRDYIRTEYGETGELYYKPDIYTKKGIDATTVGKFGLSTPARYVE